MSLLALVSVMYFFMIIKCIDCVHLKSRSLFIIRFDLIDECGFWVLLRWECYLSAEIHPQPEQDEIGALEFLLTWYDIAGKVLLVGDRGYSSYALFASLLERENTDFLIRVKQGRGAMKCIADLPMREFDRQVKFTITTTQAFLNLTDNFSIFVKLRENRRYLCNIQYKAMQKDSSRHRLSSRAGSSFFTYLYSIDCQIVFFSGCSILSQGVDFLVTARKLCRFINGSLRV